MISKNAIEFIVAQTDSPQAYFNRTEGGFDWPGGCAGATVGIGYDLGYVTVNECVNDWTGIVYPPTLNQMIEAVGLTGHRAHLFVEQNHREVSIIWAQALREFTEREIPKWEHRMSMVLPNWDLLPPDCAGMLVSLGHDRGVLGFNSSLPRYTEMLNIRIAMQSRRFDLIPGEIEAMVRLTSELDVRRRRRLEAQIFASGLVEKAASAPPATSPTPS